MIELALCTVQGSVDRVIAAVEPRATSPTASTPAFSSVDIFPCLANAGMPDPLLHNSFSQPHLIEPDKNLDSTWKVDKTLLEAVEVGSTRRTCQDIGSCREDTEADGARTEKPASPHAGAIGGRNSDVMNKLGGSNFDYSGGSNRSISLPEAAAAAAAELSDWLFGQQTPKTKLQNLRSLKSNVTEPPQYKAAVSVEAVSVQPGMEADPGQA